MILFAEILWALIRITAVFVIMYITFYSLMKAVFDEDAKTRIKWGVLYLCICIVLILLVIFVGERPAQELPQWLEFILYWS